jgi:hypothetical protein
MSNALRDAVESGATTFSDLVDQARTRIEDLPPLAHARRKRARKHWSPLLVVLLVTALAVAMMAKRHQHKPEDHLLRA